MNGRPSGLKLVCAVTVLAWCAAAPAWAAPIGLEIAGEPAPANLSAMESEDVRYVPASALVVLGWAARWQNEERSSVEVTDGKITAQFEAASDTATVARLRSTSPRDRRLDAPAIQQDGQLLLPASALADLLEVPVEWDAPSRTVRVGMIPAPADDAVRKWAKMLKIPEPGVFHRTGFRVNVSAPHGTELPVEQEFLLTMRASADGCVQLFERYEEYPPKNLPLSREGVWARTTAWRVLGRAFVTPPAGKVIYVVIATTDDNPPSDLLTALRGDDPPKGDWAIDAVELTVTERPAESGTSD